MDWVFEGRSLKINLISIFDASTAYNDVILYSVPYKIMVNYYCVDVLKFNSAPTEQKCELKCSVIYAGSSMKESRSHFDFACFSSLNDQY